jgi:DNA mismatch repair protein MutS
VHSEIDELGNRDDRLLAKLDIIKDAILQMLNTSDTNYVVIKRLEKEGFSLNLTKNRFANIKDEFSNAHLVIDDEVVLFKDFNLKIGVNSVKITGGIIDTISDKYVHNLGKLIELNKIIFREKILFYEKKFATILEEIVKFIAEVDLTVSNIITSKKYNYSCPQIIKTEDNFLEILELRHPIIEANQSKGQGEIYIPNDIVLGELNLAKKELRKSNIIIKNSRPNNMQSNPMHGILLYGINSAGKSSLMKSVGISVLLAQSGFFVPANSMRFGLFDSIFTRILGNDNIKRGLSSFAVEMLELKNIFNRATKKSLILGDEISHSTETLSGVSIVASAIMKLSKLESIFIFATHLHQITELPEIEDINTIMPLHLSVMYQDNDDKLIFDRKLKYGRGSSVYGLEFARSLHIDDEFLKNANAIRKRLSDDYNPVERLTQKNRSKYNKDLYQVACAICGAKVDEVHHIKEQSNANDDGFIGHINVNHKYNLIPLCAKHHKAVHSGKLHINGFVTTSKGIELHYTNAEEE